MHKHLQIARGGIKQPLESVPVESERSEYMSHALVMRELFKRAVARRQSALDRAVSSVQPMNRLDLATTPSHTDSISSQQTR